MTPVLLFALLPALAAAQSLPDADALFARGVDLHRSGDVVGAIEAYLAALEKDPARVDARSNLGAAYARLGRYDDAVREYGAVLAAHPEATPVRFNLALALYKGTRITEAAAELERVVAEDPKNGSAALLLADCWLQMGRNAAVVSLLEPRAAELGEDRLYAYLLGHALLRGNDLRKAQVHIERLLHGGDPGQAHLLLGIAHLQRGDSRAAVPELEKAAERLPDQPGIHSLLGRALMGVSRRDEAVQAFRRELERNPNDFDSNLYIGFSLKDANRLDEAEPHLRRAQRLRSHDPGVLYALGSLHLAAGRAEEARQALESVVSAVPKYEQAHVLLATAYYRLKDRAKGDQHRAAAEALRAERQASDPGPVDELSPAYSGSRP
jgi:tetratricopeptide (TPR) repeat protein